MTPPKDNPVEPELFTFITHYAEAVDAGEVDTDRPLSGDTPVVQFCLAFFQQFFENEIGFEITGIDKEAKAASVKRRTRMKNVKSTLPARQLMYSFEDLCDAWPNVLGFGYGGSRAEFKEFHSKYVPRLLNRITAWAETADYPEIAEAAESAAEIYGASVENL